ncbi:MAG: hypothetical protein WA858_01345, partial [Xanthobacteraceae bacterium]
MVSGNFEPRRQIPRHGKYACFFHDGGQYVDAQCSLPINFYFRTQAIDHSQKDIDERDAPVVVVACHSRRGVAWR